MKYPALGLLLLFAAAPICIAQPSPSPKANPADTFARDEEIARSIHLQAGPIILRNGLAKLNLPADERYLNPEDSAKVLHDLWHNPLRENPLGMIVPADFDPVRRSSWAVVVEYADEGHVSDSDASKIDYDKLLKQMQEAAHEANAARVKEGYPEINLIGWATKPHYDAASHKLYWAKEIKFGDHPTHTLNYNIRVLGRTGFLELNVVASMRQLAEVEKLTPSILAAADFEPGNRYADFQQGTDKVATYGIAALVAGGIAAKAGLFKVIWLTVLAFKKLIIVGFMACVGFFKKLFGRKKTEPGLRPETPSRFP